VFRIGDEETKYVYQISYQGTTYILKGFKIQVEHVNPEQRTSAKIFEENLIQISEIFQQYHFIRATSLITPHIAKPLSLDSTVELAKSRASHSYLHVQIIFEYGGVALNKLQPTTIEQTYNLMRQSANALLSLHNLGIAHFDIRPTNMVYDDKKDLLKIVNMWSAFGGSNRKELAATTMSLEEKVRNFTPEFAPPEVLFMEKDLTKELNLKLYLPGIDVYCWAMSFFAILTNKSNIDLKNYKRKSEENYKRFMEKIVKISFDSVESKSPKEVELMKVVSNLLTRALQYKPEERPKIKDAIREMKKFEKEKKHTLNYSSTELEHIKKLLKLFISNDDSLGELLNKIKDMEENGVVNSMSDLLKSSSCNHEVSRDKVIKYVLKLFMYGESYKYSCLCEVCKKVVNLEYIPLYCGCKWTMLGQKVKFNSDLTKGDYGKCSKGHPLSSIDLGLLNDFISFKLTSLMISDYLKEEEELVNLFSNLIKRQEIEDIAWILRYTKTVTKLNLYGNNIGDEGAKAIGEALRTNTTLKQLNLSGNKIGYECAKVIGEVLKTNTTLTELNLSWNEIGDEGAKVIGGALRTNTTLTELYLSGNYIRDKAAKVIGEVLRTNTTLTKLNLSRNEIGYEGAKVISEVLKTNKTLTKLNLSDNKIGGEGVRVIGEVLRTNTTLKELNLSENKIGDEGAKVIGKIGLIKLNLYGNNIRDEGAKLIGEALKTNTTLTRLNLYGNNIEDEGAKVIGEALRINTTLTRLNLYGNNIGDEGAKVIGEALRINTTLTELDLSYNKIGDEGKKVIDEVRANKKGIEIRY